MSEIHEHLEHAEHAEHAAHNPFDRKVAVSIAIIAAVLAGVAMIGHRTHNQTLLYQAEAAGFDVQSGNSKIQAANMKVQGANIEVQESNAWAQYQAKKLRETMAKNAITSLNLLAVGTGKETDRDQTVKKYSDEVARYADELKELQTKAEGIHAKIADFDGKAKAFEDKSKGFETKAKEGEHNAHHSHAQADYLDLAHLAVELGLVICSVALLTKKKAYWLGGIVFTIVGLCLVSYSMMLPKHAEHHDEHPVESAPAHVEKAH